MRHNLSVRIFFSLSGENNQTSSYGDAMSGGKSLDLGISRLNRTILLW